VEQPRQLDAALPVNGHTDLKEVVMLTELAPKDALGGADPEPTGGLRLETGEFLTYLLMAASTALKTVFSHRRGRRNGHAVALEGPIG
jgi:hypothetical protein